MLYGQTIRVLISLALLGLTASCGGGGGGGGGITTAVTTQDTLRVQDLTVTDQQIGSDAPELVLNGAAVKGPLANAQVRVFAFDAARPGFYDPAALLAQARTDGEGNFNGLKLPRNATGPFVVVVDGSDAIDTMSGKTPVLRELLHVIDRNTVRAGKPVYPNPLTTVAVRMAQSKLALGAAPAEFMTTLADSAKDLRDALGLGLSADADILSIPPVVDASVRSQSALQEVTQLRASMEAVASAAHRAASASESTASPMTSDDVLLELAADLASDGVVDNRANGIPVAGIDPASLQVAAQDFTIVNTDIRLSEVAQTLIQEAATRQPEAAKLDVTEASATLTKPTLRAEQKRVENTAPIADAGADMSVAVGTAVQFDARGSRDPQGDRLSYRWQIRTAPAGSTSELLAATTAQPNILADVAGSYILELVVSDGHLDSLPDTLTLTVTSPETNQAPVAVAGTDQRVSVGQPVSLDGSASHDAEGEALSFRWRMRSAPAGSVAALTSPHNAVTAFSPDQPGLYVVELVVDDGDAESAPATIAVVAVSTNNAPQARVGSDMHAAVGDVLRLDGRASVDPDGDALSFFWRLKDKPTGSLANLTGTTTATASFTPDRAGVYSVDLTVSDGALLSTPAVLTITVTQPNRAPLAQIGGPANAISATTVRFDGSTSSDADGDTLGYVWQLTRKPGGSVAALSGARTALAVFTADLPGLYTVRLTVSDGVLLSEPAELTVTVTQPNRSPVASAQGPLTALVGAAISLDGSASADPDGDTLTYTWSLATKPNGSATTLARATTARPSFTPDVAGSYAVRLIVNDGTLNSAAQSLTIAVTQPNRAPVARAGDDSVVSVDATVPLDGSASSDPDGDRLAYRWSLVSQPSGSALMITDADRAQASFVPRVAGSYVFALTVSDGTLNSALDQVSVLVNAAAERNRTAPEAARLLSYAPVDLEFVDDFANGSVRNSPEQTNFWQVNSDAGATVSEANGQLSIAATTSNASARISNAVSYRYNFFAQPLRLRLDGIDFGGTTPSTQERVLRLALTSAPGSQYEADDALVLQLEGDGHIRLGTKTDQSDVDTEQGAALVDQQLAAPARAIELVLDYSSYMLNIETAAGNVTFAGMHHIAYESWGVRGDSALQLEGLRARTQADGSSAVISVDQLAVKSLTFFDAFQDVDVTTPGFGPDYWRTLGAGNLNEAGGALNIESGAIAGPVSHYHNFFARDMRFSGRVAVGGAANVARFALSATQQSAAAAADALGLVLRGDKSVLLSVKKNAAGQTLESASKKLVDTALPEVATRFELSLTRDAFDLTLYWQGGQRNFTGTHGINWYTWGAQGDAALVLEGQGSSAEPVRWLQLSSTLDQPAFQAGTVYAPVADRFPLETPPVSAEQNLASMGFVDVTKAPFFADPSGLTDTTIALQHAIEYARQQYLVTFLPEGTYRVSDTLECSQGTARWTGKKILNDREGPCVLMGSRAGARPTIYLAPNSPGFGDPSNRKRVVYFWSLGYQGDREQPNISMNQMIVNVDFEVGPGNAGASVIYLRAAQSSSVQDVTIDATNGYSGLEGATGVGGSNFGVTVIGGEVGIDYTVGQPSPTLAGITLIGQRQNAIRYGSTQPLTIVGMKVVVPSNATGPAIRVTTANPLNGMLNIIDSSIAYESSSPGKAAIQTTRSVYLQNVHVRNVGKVVSASDGEVLSGNASGWLHVEEYAHGVRPPLYNAAGASYQYETSAFVDGQPAGATLLKLGRANVAAPNDLVSRHLWPNDAPSWESPGAANVKGYGASGDGVQDDTDALQQAIDENAVVFLPRGYYRISRPLQLRSDTQLLGAATHLSVIYARTGAAFQDARTPAPLLRSANDTDGTATLAFLTLHAPVDLPGAYTLQWRTGRNSVFRSVNIARASVYGRNWVPGKPNATPSSFPVAVISDNGGGKWYNYNIQDAVSTDKDYRHLLVKGTRQPLRFYQLNAETGDMEAMMEFVDTTDVDIFNMKTEGNHVNLWVRDSDRVNLYGGGGMTAAFEADYSYPAGWAQYTPSLHRIENTPNFRIVNPWDMGKVSGTGTNDYAFDTGRGVPADLWHMILERDSVGNTTLTPPLYRPVVYKRGY